MDPAVVGALAAAILPNPASSVAFLTAGGCSSAFILDAPCLGLGLASTLGALPTGPFAPAGLALMDALAGLAFMGSLAGGGTCCGEGLTFSAG